MRRATATSAAALAALGATSLAAHHSVSTIDVSTPIWVKGTVVRYEPISPHTKFELEEKTADGGVQRWTVEGPFPGRLQRILSLNGMKPDEDFLKAGDAVEVCGFYPKRRGDASQSGEALHFFHGHVLVMPDGRMQSWGPYGKIDNCIRADDRPERWLDFFSADPLAAEHWCNSKHFVDVPSTAPPGFVDELDRRMNQPCNQR